MENSNISLGKPNSLKIEDVVAVAREFKAVGNLTEEILEDVNKTSDWVTQILRDIDDGNDPRPFYGINTVSSFTSSKRSKFIQKKQTDKKGFGSLSGKSALNSSYKVQVLMRNLLASHSTGVGAFLPEDVVRASVLIRSQSLSRGYSGVRPIIIQKLIDMLNHRIFPAIPEMGSLGASGDLAPLSHLALVISEVPVPPSPEEDLHLDETDAEVFCIVRDASELEQLLNKHAENENWYKLTTDYCTGKQQLWLRKKAAEEMKRIGGKVILNGKEGLALNNGTTVSSAIAALAVQDSQNLITNSKIAYSMSMEGIRGFGDCLSEKLHQIRGHQGAMDVAKTCSEYLEGSKFIDGNPKENPKRVPPQDPYSFRCAPQVIGSIQETVSFAKKTVETEINAATDNPFIFLDYERDYKTVSGGNFHGEPIALSMDYLSIAVTELGSISERRIFKLTDYYPSESSKDQVGLPSFLISQPKETNGLHSGFMIPQYTAASLVSDCKTLAHPDSVDSITSSANQEDHVSMSMNAARHARKIVSNVEEIIGIEFLSAAQAIDLQILKEGDNKDEEYCKNLLGVGTYKAYKAIREKIPMLEQDRVFYPEIRTIVQMVRNGDIIRAVES